MQIEFMHVVDVRGERCSRVSLCNCFNCGGLAEGQRAEDFFFEVLIFVTSCFVQELSVA